MRKLSLSLILVVLISVVGLGWLINSIYSYTGAQSSPSQNTALKPLVTVSKALNSLNPSIQSAFVTSWNKTSKHTASLIELEDLPLPPSLTEKLMHGEPVILESDVGVEAYFWLNQSENILAIPVDDYISSSEQNSQELLLTLVFYSGITAIVLLWIWPLIHNLDTLRKGALKFGQGKLQTRVETGRISYIRDIETEFNHMADRIESLISDNKLLSRAVSHDLKTPLARLRFGLDALTDTKDPERKERYYERVNRDLEEMESLIDTLLQYARLDDTHISLSSKPLNILSLINKLILGHSSTEINIQCICEDPSIECQADPRYISMLINNILSNACRHAKKNVHVTLTKTHNNVLLSVEDDGQGIPLDERNNVTKPFWRGTTSREQRGHGMGMAIVERIAIWHKAEIDIGQSSTLHGAKITLTL